MKRVVLFGAGQVGAMLCRLLAGKYLPLCFADNDPKRQGGRLAGLPILSPAESLALLPEAVLLCVSDDGRAGEMARQLAALGYTGTVLRPEALRLLDVRAGTMRLLAEQIEELSLPGDLAELGVYRGDFAALLLAAFPGRKLHLFDTFTGFSERDVEMERAEGLSQARAGDFSQTSQALVAARLAAPERAVFHAGWFPESFRGCEALRFAFVSLDADLYAPTAAALPLFWERLSPGGALLVHDVNGTQFSGAGKAVREFCAAQKLLPLPICDLHGSVVLRKNLQ